MDQSITHSFAPGQKEEDATRASPRSHPADRSAPSPGVTGSPPEMQPEPLLRAIDKKPALRLLARGFDLLLFTVLFEAALAYLWPQLREGRLMLLALIPGFLFYLLLDAIFMAWFGATPGKSLLRVRVVTAGGGRVRLPGALQRSFRVGWKGLAMGLPGINLLTLHAARKRLLGSGRTSWDELGNLYVLHGRIGVMRTLVFIICSIFLVMTGSIIRFLGPDRSPGSMLMTFREVDAGPPVQIASAPPVLTGTSPDTAPLEARQPGEAASGSAPPAPSQGAAVDAAGGEAESAAPAVVMPAAKVPKHARQAGKHSIHHTVHPVATRPVSQSVKRHHAAHDSKQHASVIASHPLHRPLAHHRAPLASPKDPVAAAVAHAAPAAGDSVSVVQSTVTDAGRHAVRQGVSPIDQAADAIADAPEKSVQANDRAPTNDRAPANDPVPGNAKAWQPITSAQALGVADVAPEMGSDAAPASRRPAASSPETPLPANEERQARPATADDGFTRQRHATTEDGQAAVTAPSGNQASGPMNQMQDNYIPAAAPAAGQGSGSQASISASAQVSDPPVNVTPQAY